MDILAIGRAGLDALISFITAIPSLLILFLNIVLMVADWLFYFITHFWILFALIEIGILGIAISKKEFMEKISEFFHLHKIIYIDVLYTLFLNFVKLGISVIDTIGNYVPFT